MYDNDPKHISALVKDWLKHHPKNKSELEMLLIQEWGNIELSVFAKLVDSLPSRLNQCIQVKGYPPLTSSSNLLLINSCV